MWKKNWTHVWNIQKCKDKAKAKFFWEWKNMATKNQTTPPQKVSNEIARNYIFLFRGGWGSSSTNGDNNNEEDQGLVIQTSRFAGRFQRRG